MSEFLESLSSFLGKPNGYADEKPFQAEFFSVERLEQYAQTLAAEHKTVTRKGRAQLLPRLEDNGRKLEAAYKALVNALREGRAISPAAEWLVDNYHIVEEQLREIRQDLPKSYYHELPKLAEGELADYPRIYAVALALIAHTDSRLDTNTLQRFIAAYQTVAPLSIGELWAVAITLRLALVENLRRLAIAIARARAERDEADKLADKLLELASLQPANVMSFVSERFGKQEELPHSFLVQLVQRLREQHPSVMPVMDWIEKQLAKEGTTVEQIIHAEHQRQAAAQVTVGNIITSMRLLSTLDWNDFFEKVSLIERLLGNDPAGVYAQMEFASRDRYRHVIERISKRTRTNELDIGQAAIDLAAHANEKSPRAATRRLLPYRRRPNAARIEISLSTSHRGAIPSLSTATLHWDLSRHTQRHDLADHDAAAFLHVSLRRRLAVPDRDSIAGADTCERSRDHSAQLGPHTLLPATPAAPDGDVGRHSQRRRDIRRRADDLPERFTGARARRATRGPLSCKPGRTRLFRVAERLP